MISLNHRHRINGCVTSVPLFAAVITLATSATVMAMPITGGIRFSGHAKTDSSDLSEALKLISFTDIYVIGGVGSYSTVPGNFSNVVFNSFNFDSHTPGFVFTPLWTFAVDNGVESATYSFDATSWTIESQTDAILHIIGSGHAHVTGLEDTNFAWDFKIDANGALDFSAADHVPEGGATARLIGAALMIAVATLRRRITM